MSINKQVLFFLCIIQLFLSYVTEVSICQIVQNRNCQQISSSYVFIGIFALLYVLILCLLTAKVKLKEAPPRLDMFILKY